MLAGSRIWSSHFLLNEYFSLSKLPCCPSPPQTAVLAACYGFASCFTVLAAVCRGLSLAELGCPSRAGAPSSGCWGDPGVGRDGALWSAVPVGCRRMHARGSIAVSYLGAISQPLPSLRTECPVFVLSHLFSYHPLRKMPGFPSAAKADALVSLSASLCGQVGDESRGRGGSRLPGQLCPR